MSRTAGELPSCFKRGVNSFDYYSIIYKSMIELIKSEKDVLQCSADQDVTDWKIRVTIFDKINILKKANSNVKNGSIDQISIDEKDKSIFYVHILEDETSIFNRKAEFELELEKPNGSLTVHQDKVMFIELEA